MEHWRSHTEASVTVDAAFCQLFYGEEDLKKSFDSPSKTAHSPKAAGESSKVPLPTGVAPLFPNNTLLLKELDKNKSLILLSKKRVPFRVISPFRRFGGMRTLRKEQRASLESAPMEQAVQLIQQFLDDETIFDSEDLAIASEKLGIARALLGKATNEYFRLKWVASEQVGRRPTSIFASNGWRASRWGFEMFYCFSTVSG